MTSPDGVAVCLSCGNEWTVRAPGIKKKRKCPVCGKYRIRLKSELNEDEKGEIAGSAGSGAAPPVASIEGNSALPSPPDSATSPVVSGKPEEKAEEKEKKTSCGGLLLLVVGVAVCNFLFPSGAPRRSPAPAHGEWQR